MRNYITYTDLLEALPFATREELPLFEELLKEAVSLSRLKKTLLAMKQGAYKDQSVETLIPDGVVYDDMANAKTKDSSSKDKAMHIRQILPRLANDPDLSKAGLVDVDKSTMRAHWNLPKKGQELMKFLIQKSDPQVWEAALAANPKGDTNDVISAAYKI